MKGIQIKLPDNEGHKIPTCDLLSPNETFSTGISLHLIELLVKDHWKTQIFAL